MNCSELKPSFSFYLDGALPGAEMRQTSDHLTGCPACMAGFKQLEHSQRLVASLGRKQPPPDLALRLNIALSQAASQTYKRRLQGMLVRWENVFNTFIFPATAGLLSAIIFFGLLIGFVAAPGTVEASSSPDVPLMLYTPPQLNASPFITSMGTDDDSLVVETYVGADGRVQDYRIISAPEGAKDLIPKLDNMMIFTTFRPATNFGRPTPSRVVLSFSGMNVKG